MIVEPSTTYIRRLRATANEPDSLALQLRLLALLNTATHHPHDLPATASVCIRALRAKLPLQRVDPLAAHGALDGLLASIVRSAARPAQGLVPADAPAVLFADRAELLACLARDWLAGAVINQWWWRGLLANSDIQRAVVAAWLESPEYVPAALHQLATTGQLVPFVRALDHVDTMELGHRVTRSFALPQAQTALDRISSIIRAPSNPPPVVRQSIDSAQSGAALAPAHVLQSVRELDGAGLTPTQRAVAMMGLLIIRAPAVVRVPSFGQDLLRWIGIDAPDEAPVVANIPSQLKPPGRVERGVVEHDASHIDPPKSTSAPTPHSSPVIPPATRQPTQVLGSAAPESQPRDGANLNAAAIASDLAWAVPEFNPASLFGAEPRLGLADGTIVAVEPEHRSFQLLTEEVETAFGGVFYLINLGLFLGLYGDFTMPLQPGIALPIWDFAALLGHQLIGAEIETDPVWLLLGRLAGREPAAPPGAAFEPPNEWRVPQEWLVPFPERGAWRWSEDEARLRVKHPAGFCVLDAPCDGSASEHQLQTELALYPDSRAGLVPGEIETLLGSPLERWLSWLMPYVRARLERALNLDDTAELPDLLLRHTGRVRITTTQLDVVLSLADLPIAVRLSGLDRDPGWVPAAGRFIAFHFT